VTLLCSGFAGAPARAEVDGLEVHRVGRRYTFSLHARRHYRRQLAHRGFDVIVEDLNKVPLFTPRWGRTPVLLLVHHLFGRTAFAEASWPVAATTVLLEAGVPRVFAHTPVVAVSPSTRDDLVRRGLPAERITVIPNGVDTDHYSPSSAHPRFAEPTLLYLGRLKRYKGVEYGIRAVARLRQAGTPVRFVVGGKGDDRERLEGLARDLGVADAVDFVGFVDEGRKIELFRRAWLHLLTSPKEGWGITVLEAAACGTPTVASDAPGLRDSVVDGRTGALVPHGDVAALAGTVGALLHDRDRREAMGRAARDHALRFSWDAAAERLEVELREAARHPGR
jgi:glycosyltransferase involved in cell wall biosynthesis